MHQNRSSLQTRISILFIILMTATMIIVGSIVFYNWKLSVDNEMVEIQNEIHTAILDTIEKFISVPLSMNEINHNLIENQIVNIYDENKRDMYFAGIMQVTEEHVYSFSYGTEQGEYYGARRSPNDKIELMRSDLKTGGKSQYYSITPDLTAGELTVSLGSFDPRDRVWYNIAKAAQIPIFSPVYKHFVMNDLAISASYPIYDKQGRLKGVLGTHILLSKLNDYLKFVQTRKTSAYIVEKQSGELVANSLAIPNFTMNSDGSMSRVTVEEINNKNIMEAYKNYKPDDNNLSIVNSGDEKLHIKTTELKKTGLDWLIITVIPERPYTTVIYHSIYIAMLLAIFAIIGAIFIWTKSIDQYLKPIYSLIRTTEKFSIGDHSQRAKIVRNDEIGQLAYAFNKMAEQIGLLIANLEEKVLERTNKLLQAKEKLELLSRTDFLTELYNRRVTLEKAEEEIKRFYRTKQSFAVVMGDLDHFKNVNDTYGHDCGDFILKEVANILRKLSRETDIASRWGGEEFLLLLPQTDGEGAFILAEKLRQSIEAKNYIYQEQLLKLTMTFGIAVYKEDMTIDEVIKNADIAIYNGKKSGRNQVVQFKE